MDDGGVGGKIVGEIAAGGKGEPGVGATDGADEPGQLHRADVLAGAVVGATLGDEHGVLVSEAFQGAHCFQLSSQVALIAGHEDGKRREWDLGRQQSVYLAEDLGVGHHQARRPGEGGQQVRQPFDAGGAGEGAHFQRVAHDLLLGQDDATLGGGGVQRDDEHDHITGLEQVAHEPPLPRRVGGQGGEGALQVVQSLPCPRRYAHADGPERSTPRSFRTATPSLLTGTSAKRQGGIAVALNSFLDPLGSSVFFSQRSAETFARLWRSGRAQYLSRLKQGRLIRGTSALFLHKQVGFVLGDDVGDAARLEGSDEPLVEGSHAAGGVHNEHGHVGLVQGGFGSLDT